MTQVLMTRRLDALRPADAQARDALSKVSPGTTVRVELKRVRNPRQHRLYWALVHLVFQHQSRYATQEQLHNAIKVRVGYYDELETPTGVVCIPKSISFGNMPQQAFEEFFGAVVRLVCEHLIPGTTDAELREELESMIGATE